MRFTVHCPKCSSPRVSLQMDRDTVFFHNGTGRPYLHCAHCGNVLYDNKAIEAIEQQKNAFDLKVAEAERSRKQKLEQERIDRELRLQKKPEETLSPNAALSTREVGVLIKTRNVSTPVAATMPTLAPQPPKATVAAVKPVEAPQAPVKVSAKAEKPVKPAKAEKPVKAESLDANAVRKAVLHDGARDTGCPMKIFRRDRVQCIRPVHGDGRNAVLFRNENCLMIFCMK